MFARLQSKTLNFYEISVIYAIFDILKRNLLTVISIFCQQLLLRVYYSYVHLRKV